MALIALADRGHAHLRMPRARQEIDKVPDGLAEETERAVRQSGALPLRRIKPAQGALTRRAQGLLFEALARRGLERTARSLRVPLRDQVSALLDGGAPIATTALRKRLGGVESAAELKLVVHDLVRSGRAALVMRAGKEHIAPRDGALLSREQVARIADVAKALARLAASTRARAGQAPRTLLRADVLALLDPARCGLDAGEPGAADGDPVALVVAAVRARTDPTTGLAFVPEVARALDGRLAGDALRAALVGAARSGLVELRPESGVELLSPADAAICPRGPDGSPLSWLRIVAKERP
jgi:hypothetical protein